MYDPNHRIKIGIIGGGPAGMSCALWLKQLGLVPIIIEMNSSLGGQLLQIDRINRWVLGVVNKTSREIGLSYIDHINSEGINVMAQSRIVSLTTDSKGFELVIDQACNVRPVDVRGLVIATGVRVIGDERFNDIPGFQSVHEKGLISFFPLDHLDKLELLKQKTVAVIGGGNNAYYTALDAAKSGATVYLLVRSKPKARNHVQKEAEFFIEKKIITVFTESQVSEFRQQGGRMAIHVAGNNLSTERLEVDRVFVRAGFAANSDFMNTFEALSGINKQGGYIETDDKKRTSIPWVYAIGDIANPRYQSLVAAIADGAVAAQDISDRL
ncbi:MAG: FAD-dependent oxidoreductase [Methylococcaceae bacterium]|nr:FAD-dependent oxidoreductase [Methylococcaceae bacterium]